MDEFDGMSVEQIMGQIRHRLQANIPPPPARVVRYLARELDEEIETLGSSVDLFQMNSPKGRRLLGPILTLVRRVVLRIFTPVLAKQTTYNAACARIAERLRVQCNLMADHHDRIVEDLLRAQSALRDMVANLAEQQRQFRGKDLPEKPPEVREE